MPVTPIVKMIAGFEDVLIGRTETGEKVTMRAELRYQEHRDAYETTDHRIVSRPVEFSASAARWGRQQSFRSTRGPYCIGQLPGILTEITKPARGVEMADVKLLDKVWREWHLNAMVAGCDHQTVVYEDSDYGRRPSLALTPKCPQSGYRYGSAWLVKEMPAEVQEQIVALIGRLASTGQVR